jgi:phosphate transport system substrate-binding protein
MNVKRMVLAAMVLALAAGLGIAQELTGAGATFPAPFYTKVFDQYAKEFGVKVNYQAIGSGGGIAQIKSTTVDFGASDAFLKDADIAGMPAAVLHVPVVAGAVVLTYNLPGNPELRFTPDVVADIFLGTIKNWNDPRITAINPSANLPRSAITVVHRSDGSGTTSVFTDYLGKVSSEWKTRVGSNTSVSWPAGIGGKGNSGVAGLVKQLPGSFGYVELIYAMANKMPYASLRNKAGSFITPSLESTSAACAVDMPADTRVSVTDTGAPDGYPIAGFTWILLYKEQNYGNRPREKADAMVKMLWWMTHEAQKYAEPLEYARLPGPVVKKAEAILRSVTFDGTPLMK